MNPVNPFNTGYIPGPNVLNPPNPIAQLNPYGQSLPNLNYGIPGGLAGSANPLLNSNMNQGMGGTNPNMGNINPFDPNQNFLQQNMYANPMMNPNNNFQNVPNMANNIVLNDPDLQINQIMEDRMLEREKVKEQTKEIYKRLSDKYDDEQQDLEEMKKKEQELEQIEEDEKKKKDSREERNKRRELLFGKGGLYNIPVDIFLPRSEYFYKRDRAFLEELILAPIKTMGALGKKLVTEFNKEYLLEDKEAFQEQDVLQLNDEDEYFEQAIKDGIYLDYVKQQLFSFNINKTEQRMFREENKSWFRPNGDIRMDNDIFSDIVTKPMDISLSSNDQFSTFVSNSIFSGRGNGKMRLFKLRILIGKIMFRSHPMFSEEDSAVSQLIYLHKDFYSTLNMLNIPYLKKKRKNIQLKLDSYNNIHQLNEAQEIEIKNMKIFLDETSKLLAKEKKIINQKANLLYNKWLDLKKIRRDQGFTGNPIKLNVIRFNDNDKDPNIYDYAFILTNDKEVDILPKEEENRRNKITKNLVHLKIYINGAFAFETKPSPMIYPGYEVEINSQFVMNLYTRPTKFEIELYINNRLEKKFEAEPPGMFSKTVTSSAILYEEIDFGKKKEEEKDNSKLNQKKKSKKNEDEEKNKLLDERNIIEDEEELKEKPKEKEKTFLDNQLIEGSILLKTEWEGRAPDLPPTKIEDKLELVNKQLEFKENIKKEFDIEYPFDVNDPRNVASVQEMKKEKLELMLKVYYKEYLLTYYDIYSKRHELLLKRLSKKSMDKLKFPILESQIEKSKELMEILEEFKRDEKSREIEEDHEWQKKVKSSLEALKKKHKGRILTDEEYLEYQKSKIAAMKKDQVLRGAAGYFQVVSQAEIIDNPAMLFKEFFMRVFTRSRKLAPIRVKPAPVKIEKADKIKVNIHIVKGYNIPIRINSPIQANIDERKLYAVTHNSIYLNSVNQADRRQEVFRNSFNMQNNIMNNSGPFSNNPHSNNESFSIGMNNSRGFGPMGMMGRNPNFNNQMINPNNSNLSMYGNMGGDRDDILDQIHNISSIEQNRINSFVEVRVTYYDQEAVFRTDSIESIHPDYNHQFEFYIKPKDGKKTFTREELSKCPGVFYFTLYDEIKREYSMSDKINNIYVQKNERKYLGSFNIPFATVFQNASILDTICKVEIPKAVFGYYSDTTSIFNIDTGEEEDTNITERLEEDDNASNNYQGVQGLGNLHHFAQRQKKKIFEVKQIINPFVNSYISLYITLDPIPSFSINDETDYVSGFEDNGFLINATKWLNTLKDNAKFKIRTIRFFAENIDGCSVFMPRYLKKDGQMPYQQLFNENDDNAIEKATRYVSLIPFIEENQTWDYAEEMPDCWTTDNQFLDLGFGDYEEHAVLLCNYFNYIDQKQKTGCVSYLCLGDAHPEGSTVYVIRLTPDFKEVEFWNAKTGECFYFEKTLVETKFLCLPMSAQYKNSKSNSNKICPLKSVGAIVTFDNILINIQDETDPGLLDFDLNNQALWLPFLTDEARDRYFPEGIKSVQKPIEYTDPSEAEALKLKEAIRDYLKRVIREERAKTKGPGDKPLKTEGLNRVNPNIERILEQYEIHNFNETKSVINYNRRKQGNKDREEIRNKRHYLEDLEKLQKEIKDELRDKNNVYGFPINISFTTMKEIWQQIKLTNVHLIGEENSELNLSIYVDPLPSGVNSVWIFLAILQNN